MTRLRAIAEEHGLKIIEDASHALGASWRDHRCGSLGDISVVSLQGDKLAPAGEGGMFLTRDDAYMERATCMGDIMRILEIQGPSQRFAGTSFGIKTRMAPLCAAVARTQFRHLPERMARRTQNLVYLSKRLEELDFDTYLAPPHVERVYFEFIIRYDEQRWGMPIEVLVKALQAEGCSVDSPRYPLLHQQPLFTEGRFADIARFGDRSDVELPQYRPDALPITEAASREFLRLPTFSSAEPELLDQYADAFEKTLTNADAILKGIC
jgi:dTDP-4-amino-4,6-dideoxygalactose transaminase